MKTWLITGVGRGLGNALAKEVLAAGHCVIGTVRRQSDADAFEALNEKNAIAIQLDLADHEHTKSTLFTQTKRPGGIDVLVNNAGYGLYGAVEEVSLDELRKNFDVNFFGAVASIQAVLPHFRSRCAGHIVNITSVAGLAPWAGTAAYGATKYALECLGQTLAQEMKPFRVKVTNVAPGGVDTDFAKRSLLVANEEIAAYKETVAHLPRTLAKGANSAMPGDAVKAAKAIIRVVDSDDPPVHLLLGADAVHYAGQQMTKFISDMTDWMPLTMSIEK